MTASAAGAATATTRATTTLSLCYSYDDELQRTSPYQIAVQITVVK